MPPKHSEGGVEEAEWRRREQSIDPKAAAVFSRSAEKRSLGQKCSGLAMLRTQSTDGGSVRKAVNLRAPGGVDNPGIAIGWRR